MIGMNDSSKVKLRDELMMHPGCSDGIPESW